MGMGEGKRMKGRENGEECERRLLYHVNEHLPKPPDRAIYSRVHDKKFLKFMRYAEYTKFRDAYFISWRLLVYETHGKEAFGSRARTKGTIIMEYTLRDFFFFFAIDSPFLLRAFIA